MTKDDCVKLLKDYMDVLKVDYGIKSISLFGSTARGEQTVNSDIDLFVDTQTPNPFKLMDAREFLERITGLPVDIVRNHQHLNPRLRKRIEKDAVTIFWDVMKDIEQDSIRNFKFQPNKGSIVIDEPDEDDYHFHIK